MKITTQQLNIIFSTAVREYVNSNAGVLSPQEHTTKCWIKAINTHLDLRLELEFPQQVVITPDEEGE